MVWGRAGSATLTASGTDLSVTSITNSKTGLVIGSHSSGGTAIKLNGENGTNGSGNYAVRREVNGGGDSTNTGRNGDNAYITDTRANPHFNVTYFVNVSDKEKLWINSNVHQNSSGNNAPQSEVGVGKWANTSDSVSQFDYHCWNGTYLSGDSIDVLNSDVTTASAVPALDNVQDNSLFVDRENANRYWFTASSDFDFSASSSGAVSNQPTDATEVGQLITSTTHRGKKAKSATFYVKRVGSPSGTMVYKIRKSSDNSVVATSTGTSASALSTSTTAVTLNFNDEVIPSENIRVTVSGVTGSSGNLVTVMGGGADTVADQRLSVWGGSSWTEYDNDCAGKLTFTESWTMQPTKEDNFSSWVTSNSAKFVYNSTNNNIDILNSNAYDNIYYDLGSVSDTKWLCKFKVTLTTAGSQSLGFAYFYVGSTTGDANESNDGLGFYFYDNANNTYALADNGNRPDQTTVTGALGISPSTTTYYAEMKRTSATSFTVTLYSDSSYSTSLGTATLTVSSGITGLQYFKIMGYNTTGGLVGTLDDFKFYNGVTSVN